MTPRPIARCGLVVPIAAATLLLHLADNALLTYGVFRDELYYLACSRRPVLGYVDLPPLSSWLLAAVRLLLGESVFAVRLVPSIANAATVVLAGALCARLGGGPPAQTLAAVAVAVAPGLLGMFGIYSMNAIDILLWTIAALLVLRVLGGRGPQTRAWLQLGVVVGLGLLNKISMGWLAAGLAIGFLLTPERRRLAAPAPWIAAAIAAALFLPYVLWNAAHDFAHLEFMRNAATWKYASQNPISFFSGAALAFHPLALPIWIAGFWILFAGERREHRVLGVAVAAVLAILLANVHSKTEYFNPAMPLLFAAGAVAIERAAASRFPRALGAYAAILALTGLALIPFALDVLPVPAYVAYARALGIAPATAESQRLGALPQHFADRHGWRELAESVARAQRSLTPEERAHAIVFSQNYGEAAAIERFGRELGLPPSYSGHNSFWLWGPPPESAAVVLIVGGRESDHRRVFGEVTLVEMHAHPLAMPYETDLPIFVCRKRKVSMAEAWPRSRHFI